MSRNPYTGQSGDLGPLFAPRPGADFSGSDYRPEQDRARLTKQIAAVHAAMADGQWRTLAEIAHAAGCGEASASAQMRNLRKPQFGGHAIERARNAEGSGLWLYRLLPQPSDRAAEASR